MYNRIGKIYKPIDIDLDTGEIDSLLKIRYKTYFGGESFFLLHLTPNKEFLGVRLEQNDRVLPIYIKKGKAQALALQTEKEITLVNEKFLKNYYAKVFKNKKIRFEDDIKIFISLFVERFDSQPTSVKEAFSKDKTFINIGYLLDIDNEKDYFVIEFNEEDNLQISSNSDIYLLGNRSGILNI
jgi:hypothetical protein